MASGASSSSPLPSGLLENWTRVQLAQSARARFHDEGFLSVTGAFSSPTGYDPFSDIAHDYDSPVAAHLDPLSISVHGVKNVGGVDIGYDPIDRDLAIVVLVILSFPSLELKHTFKRRIKPTQPYVPSFLSMRELEHVEGIYDEAVEVLPDIDKPDVVFVDGFGRWHERQAGLATAFGVERGLVTIGIGKEYQPLRPDLAQFVCDDMWEAPMPPWPHHERERENFRTKQKLFRHYAQQALQSRGDWLGVPLYRHGPLVGAAVLTAPLLKPRASTTPAYISPGHGICLGSAIALTVACCMRRGVKLPEPIVLADRIGREELRAIRQEKEDAALTGTRIDISAGAARRATSEKA
ncbi:endonuclease V-domain-containing protein [Papiliotrema laurentii]|uniref:Endonuclease V-domain-containing protein n=1 Tax=Papiliotrema laurentii TaxID=5418 RepID=A0AAD9L653_PAPLA|nr:endonuclease V-domain-containing protein [Papiliotrema laurentii]